MMTPAPIHNMSSGYRAPTNTRNGINASNIATPKDIREKTSHLLGVTDKMSIKIACALAMRNCSGCRNVQTTSVEITIAPISKVQAAIFTGQFMIECRMLSGACVVTEIGDSGIGVNRGWPGSGNRLCPLLPSRPPRKVRSPPAFVSPCRCGSVSGVSGSAQSAPSAVE